MNGHPNANRYAGSVRLSLADPLRADPLGADIDGAWWPWTDRLTNELPSLIAALTPALGLVSAIEVNWPALQRPPDFNAPSPHTKRHHIITVCGQESRVRLLIIPYNADRQLGSMVLRQAVGAPVDAHSRKQRMYEIASDIVLAARRQQAHRQGAELP